MKLALPSQAGAFAPPPVPASHLRTVAGTPSEVDLRRLSSIALYSRRWLAGGKHLPITFRASPTPSERLPSTFRIRGDASRQGHERQNSGRRHADTKNLPPTFRAPGSTFLIASCRGRCVRLQAVRPPPLHT